MVKFISAPLAFVMGAIHSGKNVIIHCLAGVSNCIQLFYSMMSDAYRDVFIVVFEALIGLASLLLTSILPQLIQNS
jgi:hypothetical protein